jgi:WD40 repeat protein
VAQLFDVATAKGKFIRGFRTRTVDGDIDVRAVAFSPDGRQVLAVGRKAVVWEAATGRLIRSFPLGRSLTSVAFSADGKQLLTGGNDQVAHLWDIAGGKEIRSVQTRDYTGPVSPSSGGSLAVAFSPDGKRLLTAGEGRTFTALDHVAQLWDAETGKEIRAFRKQVYALTSATFSPDGKQTLTANEDKLARLWDVAGAKQIRVFRGHTDPVNAAVFSADGTQVLTGAGDLRSPDLKSVYRTGADGRWVGPAMRAPFPGRDNSARLWDVASGKEIRSYSGHVLYIRSVAISPDGTRVLTASADRTVRLWDAANGKVLRVFPEMNRIWSLVFSPDGKQMLTGSDDPTHKRDNTARLWNLDSGGQHRVFEGGRLGVTSVVFSPDGTQVLTGGQVVRLWDTASGGEIRTFPPSWGPAAFSPDGKQVVMGDLDGTVRLCDTSTGNQLRSFRGHSHAVTSVAFSPDGKQLLTGSGGEASTRLWDSASGRELCRLVGFRDGSWVAITPDHFYMSSRGNLEGVAFRLGDRVFSFDQFDLKYNRPDKVLAAIGLASQEVIAAHRHAYEKRLKRMGVTEDMLSSDFHVPEVVVSSDATLTTRDKRLKLKVQASDSAYLLDRLLVYVNGVPAHDSGGISLRKQRVQSWQQEIDIELSSGKNKIDVSVLNEKGAESLKGTVAIDYQAPAGKPDLYVVAVGVSDYQDARYRLTYADKDARDLAGLCEGKRERFGQVRVLRLLNRDATRENILKARDFLGKAQVDDQVVLFFAGHGLLDAKLDYYFATADIDFKNPAKRGLPYDAVEGLLDGIRARKKLVLMDTCHSGELDKDEVKLVQAEKVPEGNVKARAFRGLEPLERKPRLGLSNSYQLLQEMFADLRRGTGAMVIASAGGAEYALESKDWQNGVFTYAVLRGLKGEADRDKDGRVSVSELRDFVQEEVRRLTRGRQVPTARRENLEVDFSLD